MSVRVAVAAAGNFPPSFCLFLFFLFWSAWSADSSLLRRGRAGTQQRIRDSGGGELDGFGEIGVC